MLDLDIISAQFQNSYLDFGAVTTFHNQTKMHSGLWNRQRPRRYYDFPADTILEDEEERRIINVPRINICEDVILADVLKNRRTYTFKDYDGIFSKEELFTMLNLMGGVTGCKDYYSYNAKKEEVYHVQQLRSYPSGGGLYPVEMYMYIRNIPDIEEGSYVYNPIHNRLIQIGKAVPLSEVEELLPMTAVKVDPNNASLERCNVLLFLIANFKYSSYKYGKLAYKLAMLEAGHIGQNVQLACTALKKKTTALCGFYDDKVEDFFGLDGKKKVCLYVFTVG